MKMILDEIKRKVELTYISDLRDEKNRKNVLNAILWLFEQYEYDQIEYAMNYVDGTNSTYTKEQLKEKVINELKELENQQ